MMRRGLLLRALLAVAARRGLPVWVRWGSCSWLLERKRRQIGDRRFRSTLSRLQERRVRHLTLSPQAADDLHRATGIRRSQLIYNARPALDLDPTPPEDPPLVVNVASVQPRKGPDLFIQVADLVCAHHPTVRFAWVGGAVADFAEQLAGTEHRERIRFVGWSSDVDEYVRRSSAMLFTSRSEAFGLAVVDAMANARPVVAFGGTGAAFAVGDTGAIVPPFDVDMAAERLLEIIERPARQRVSSDAAERFRSLFSPQSFAERFVEILHDPASHVHLAGRSTS